MTTEHLETFLTLGSLLVLGGVAALVLAGLLQALSGASPLSWIAERAYGLELWAAFALAAIAMAGSLYFSEHASFIPCTLCWYQRIAMYPLVVLLGIAAARRDRGMPLYGLVLSLIGLLVSVYHMQLTWFPGQASLCRQGALCEVEWFKIWGFATIPYLAFSAFAGIAALSALALWCDRGGDDED